VSYPFTPFEPFILFVLNFSGSMTLWSDLGQAFMSHDPVKQGGRRADAQIESHRDGRRCMEFGSTTS
jgi:hypothetical protein